MTKLEKIVEDCLKKLNHKEGRISCYGDVCSICQYSVFCPHDTSVTAEQIIAELNKEI